MKGVGVVIAALAALACWHLCLRWNGFSLPLISDEGEYAYEARVLRDGGVPYRDAYNQKPPMVFFLYRWAYFAAGRLERASTVGESPSPDFGPSRAALGIAPRMLAAGGCWLTMGLLFLLTPRRWSAAARLGAPAAFGTLSTAPVGDMGFAANTEVFLCAFAASAAWAVQRAGGSRSPGPWLGWAGVFCGAAFMTKQTALWIILAFGALVCLRARSRWRESCCYALGCGFIPALFILYFHVRGGLPDFIEQAFLRNMDYATLLQAASGVGDQLGWLFGTLAPQFLKGGWPICALALTGLAGKQARAWGDVEVLYAVWFGAAATGVCTGLFFFPHYFLQILPPAALLAAAGIERLRERLPSAAGVGLVVGIALYPALAHARAYFLDPPRVLARRLLYPNPLFESVDMAEYIRRHSSPEEPMYVFGSEPQIYVYAGRRAATRHIFVYPLTMFPKRGSDVSGELRTLSELRPRFIVYTSQGASTLVASRLGEAFRAGIRDLLSSGYRWVGTVELRPEGSRQAFWSGGGDFSGPLPDWNEADRLWLFERAVNGPRGQ